MLSPEQSATLQRFEVAKERLLENSNSVKDFYILSPYLEYFSVLSEIISSQGFIDTLDNIEQDFIFSQFDRIILRIREYKSRSAIIINNVHPLFLEFDQFISQLDSRVNKNTSVRLTFLFFKISQIRSSINIVHQEYINRIEVEKKNREYDIQLKELSEKTHNDAQIIEELKIRMQREIEDISERYKDKLTDFEVLKQEQIFIDTARSNKLTSRIWIVGIIITSIILIWTAACFIESCWSDSCNIFSIYEKRADVYLKTLFFYDLTKRVLLRFFILSIIILILKFCLKNYNALMHNYTINMHKANSLAAVFRIISNIQNEAARNATLEIAAKEIFTQQKTGYLVKEESQIDFKVLEKLSSLFKTTTKPD